MILKAAQKYQAQPQAQAAGGQPLSLQDLQDPQTFQLDLTPPTKRKITKASFDSKQSGLAANEDPNDPFSQLDPMWTNKPQ